MNSGKNVKINLLFQADTSAAVSNMQTLGTLLNQISKGTTIGVNGGSLDSAVQSARQLQIHLQNAVNIDTGKLDLTKLDANLKKSGHTLQELTANLQAAGPIGQQAFVKIANAVAQAETPMIKLGSRTKDFITTIANTAKWQIASTAIHGIQGVLQSAVGHAEDLNKALNDIRIVTGYSETTMAKFAKSAAESARELSTTSTEYAKASLIFYQQGLTGADVTERADSVIKLSQVTGQSAQQVSDQMTAIWNNFAEEGGPALEYYADVLAKLGAATAADTQEITDGLSRFAAVADTVGLSYETAAAAVATVVDKTKQSSEVVGTAFKSIFARMQGLSLGETLEDGVDLNKYSEALKKVGVDVLDAKGEMRDMDDILNDLGEKWEGFGETTQTAIAQTVGGIKQYNQMIALMDNWDSIKDNIDLAKDATGELTEQQNIWADSYEASANRVKQAQNELYESFITSDALIVFNNLSAELLGGITKAIENFGGIIPVVITVISLFSKQLFPMVTYGFQKLSNNIAIWSGKAAKDVAKIQASSIQDMNASLGKAGLSEGVRQQIALSRDLLSVKREITLASQRMTETQKEEVQSHLDLYEALVTETTQLLEKKVAMEAAIRASKETIDGNSSYKSRSNMASKAVFNNFTQESQASGHSQDYIEDVIDQASSTSTSATAASIKELEAKKAQMEADRIAKQEQLKKERQRAASHEAVLNQKAIDNTASGIDTPDGEDHYEKWAAATQKVEELEAELGDTTGAYEAQLKAIDSQIARLETIKKLQQEIHDVASKTKTSDISAGKTEMTRYSEKDEVPQVADMERSMMKQSVDQMGGSMEMGEGFEVGTISVDASVANLETLFTEMGKYKIQLAEIDALNTDFQVGQEGVSQVFAEFSTKLAEMENGAQLFADAQRDLSSADAEVAASSAKVTAAQEKLNQELNKEKKNSKAIRAARKEFIAASKESTQAQLKYQSVLKKQPDIFKKMIKAQKPILASKDKFLDMAKSAGMSSDEIKVLADAFEEFRTTGDPSALNAISTAFTSMGDATRSTIGGLDSLSGEMRELLLNAGMTDEEIDPIIAKFRELANTAPEVQNGVNGVNNEFDKMQGKLNMNAEGVAKAAQGLATFVGQMSMAYSGAQTLAGVFDTSAGPMERFTSLLTGMSMILPVIAMMTKMVANAKKEDTLASIQQTIATAKETGAKGLAAVATWAQVAAEVALKIAQNPVVGAVVLGLVLAAGAAMAIYTQNTEAATEAVKEKNAEDMQQGEKVKELAGEWREQTSVMDDVIARYEKLSAAGKDTKEVLEDLKTTAGDLSNAYREMGEALDLTNKKITVNGEEVDYDVAVDRMEQAAKDGDVEMVEEYQNALDNVVNEAGKETADAAADAAMSDVALAMASDEGGAKYKDGKVTRHVGGVGAEEETAVSILAETSLGDASAGANGIDLSLSTDNSSEFLAQYEELMAAEEEIKTTLGDKADNSDTLREIQEMLDASKEEYETLKAAEQEAEKYNVFDAKEALEAEGMDIKDIDSLEEYEEYKAKLLEETGGDAQAQQAAEDWLEAQTHLQEYVDAGAKIDYITSAEKGGEWEGKSDELQAYYDSLSEEEKAFFLEVDFNEATTIEEVQEEIEKAQAEANKAERVQIATDLEIDEDEFETYVNLLKEQNKAQIEAYGGAEQFEQAMTDIAAANKRMEKGVKVLCDDWEDFDKVMSDSEASASDIATVLPDINDGLQDVLNLSDEQFELLPPDFAQKNWDLIQDVVNGVEGSVDKLRDKAGEEMLLNIDGAVDADGTIKEELAGLHSEIAGFDDQEFEVGVAIDDTNFIQKCNDMIAAAGMTAEQAESYFAAMGYDAEVEEKPVTTTTTRTVEYPVIDERTGYPTGEKKSMELTETTGTTAYAIKTITPNGSYGGDVNVETTAPETSRETLDEGGGGSGNEPEKVDEIDKDDVVERYKETEDALDDVRDAYDDASKAADRLYGAGRIAAMAKANAQLLKEIGLLKEKKKQAQEYLKLDRAEADRAASEAGVTLQYDANGNIVNYTHELSHLVDEYNDLVRATNAAGGATEEEKERLDEKKEKIDNLTESIEKYNQTQEEVEEIENEMQDKFYEWQDNNFEMWNHSLEVSLDITDDAKEVLDILLSRTEGDFFKQAEGLALMGGQLALVNVEMGSYIGHLGMLGGLMATNSISPADFVEGLGQVKDGAFAAAQAIFELDEQMIHYYGNALAMAREEIDLYTDQLAQCTSVLEHYLSLMDLMGHQTDYKKRGIVLEGRVKTLKNELDALQTEADYMQKEADNKKRMLDRAILPTSEEVFKQQYEDALSAAMETQEEFLAKAEEYAEALNEQLENSLNAANQDLEDALTGGKSFDQLITGMERLVSLEEEYLTNTNKIYETEKLMNKAQQEIDKTTNTVAKQKLKQFIAETDQLKEKTKLSKFELDVQQAKYELLLAEIALEEAQNAKSQVRLQRDKEGNFGYVYTADSSAIADAEQELADKQNEFYNIALEGINTYAEKYAQTLQEMYDTLTEIDQQYHEGAFASEDEYLAAREAAMTYYYDKLGQYSELYNIAIQLDSNATADAWGEDYKDMVNSTEQWKTATKTHADAVKATFGEWKMAMDLLASQTSTRMDQLASSVKKVTDKSDELAGELEEELMPKIEKEMSMVSQLTALYAALRIVVLGLAYAYMSLGVAMTFCQMAASMGSMLGAIDFGGAADAISSGVSALGEAATTEQASGGGTSPSAESAQSSNTVHIEKGDDVYEYKNGPRKGASYTADYEILKDLGDGWYSYGTGGTETGKIYRPSGFATGGYTGEWGSYGKLAVLHEKELVLNAKDTENFLASMDLLDSIVSTIDLHAANQSIGGTLNSPGLGAIGSDTLEQTVTIEANFPGVSSRTEIEEAFSTLVNRASQYANRK